MDLMGSFTWFQGENFCSMSNQGYFEAYSVQDAVRAEPALFFLYVVFGLPSPYAVVHFNSRPNNADINQMKSPIIPIQSNYLCVSGFVSIEVLVHMTSDAGQRNSR